MKANLLNLRRLTLAALLLATNIIFINLSSLFIPSGLPFCRLGLGPSIVMFASIATGPFYGALVGGLGDILAILLRGDAGNINPFITLVYALLGIFPYFFYRISIRYRKVLANPVVLMAFAFLLALAFCLVIYLGGIVPEDIPLWIKPTLVIVLSLLYIVGALLLIFLYKAHKNRFFLPVLSTVLASETLYMVIAKSIAFYFFYAYLGSSPIGYGYLLFSLLLVAPFDVVLATFLLPILLRLKGKMEGNEKKETEQDIEDLLEEEPEKKSFPWGWTIFFALTVLAMVACLIVIFAL